MRTETFRITLGFIFTLIFLITVMISVWLALSKIKLESQKNIRDSLYTVIQTTQAALHIWIRYRKDDLISLANKNEVITLTQKLITDYQNDKDIKKSPSLKKIRKIMSDKIKKNTDKGFFIIANDNTSIASMRDSNIGSQNIIHKKRERYLNRVFEGETLFIPTIASDVPLKTATGKLIEQLPTIFIATPIKNYSGEVIAVLTFRLDPSSDFTRITQLGRIGKSGETYAFDKKGILITESRFDNQLKRIGLIKAGEKGILSIKIADPGGNMIEGFIPTLPISKRSFTLMSKSAISGESSYNIDGYRDYRGVKVSGTWVWDEILGIGLTTEIDTNEAMKPYYETRFTIIVVLIFTVILAFALLALILWLEKGLREKLKKSYHVLEEKVEERTRELHTLNKELETLSFLDGLTGIANRRMFDTTLELEWNHAKRDKKPLSLILIDIDFFKQYNDNYGHVQGDKCLKLIAQIISSTLKRDTDLVSRYGGEEFVVLLPNTDLKQANILAETCRTNIIEENITHVASTVNDVVTISLGVSSVIPINFIDTSTLINEADKLLYQAKEEGRNRVISKIL